MGNKNFSTQHSLETFRKDIRPFDIVFFRGTDFVSDAIRWFQRKNINYTREDDFSHCGVIITSEVFDHPNILPGKLYVLESTVSGRLGQGIPDIDGKSFLGVQIRDFEALLPAYLTGRSQIAIGSLETNPLDTIPNSSRRILKRFYEQNNHRVYDYNPLVLGSSVCSCIRPLKYSFEDFTGPNSLMFCSEMVAELFKSLGVFDRNLRSDEVIPMDFIEKDVDEDIPENFVKEIFILNQKK